MSPAVPSTKSTPRSWEARPIAARAIRVLVILGPFAVGCVAAITANELIAPARTVAPAVLRSLAIVGLSTFIVWAFDRYARKLLPLAALMQLSLVFPDQAPSRFRSALKAGSSRRLERAVEDTRRNGLAKDPGDAARQVVQLIGAIGDHDRRTRGHSERVRLFADLVGEELKLSKEERQKLQWGALLHDLGKLMVPEEILNKKGKPDPEEWRIIQGHPAAGMDLIEPLRDFLGEWVHAIGGHHEKWDGSGYPAGLRGGQIPRSAAIVAVADSFEVMTAVRSYKKAMPLAEARAELTRCAGSHFSPEIVRAFLSISLGHLRIASGPLAALAHLPFLGNLTQLPGAAAAIVPTMAQAAIPAAAMVTAAALTVGSPPQADAYELAQAANSQATTTVVAAAPGDGAAVASANAMAPAPGETTTTTTDTSGSASASGAAANRSTETTTTAAPATTSAAPAAPATTAAKAAPTTARPATTTTTARVPSTSAAPAATAPSTTPATTAKPTTTTTTAPSGQFSIMVSTSSLRLPVQNMNGTSFAGGTKLYIYAPAMSVSKVNFTYPGGTHEADNYPYDMVSSSGLTASSWTAPSTPGTYTIKAETSGGSGSPKSATVTFTIT